MGCKEYFAHKLVRNSIGAIWRDRQEGAPSILYVEQEGKCPAQIDWQGPIGNPIPITVGARRKTARSPKTEPSGTAAVAVRPLEQKE